MAFVVEDGSIVSGANSLCDVAFADSYFSDRGITAWTGADSVKQVTLVKATDYIEQRWSNKFKGAIVDDDQVLSWPRKCVVDRQDRRIADDVVPDRLKQAVCEYAMRVMSGNELFLEPTVDETGLQLTHVHNKVGPLETEVNYTAQAPRTLRAWPAADRLIAEYVAPGDGVVRS